VWSDGPSARMAMISLTYSMRSEIPRYRKVDRSKFTFPVNRLLVTWINASPYSA